MFFISEDLHLPQTEVHVWKIEIDQSEKDIERLVNLLTVDECARARKFRFSKDRCRFITARGLLRVLSGAYTKSDPAQLIFNYGSYGKPYLAKFQNQFGLTFNLSHSREIVLFAFARRRRVGIDIEYLQEDFFWKEIAEQFFSPREVTMLLELPQEQQRKGFFNCWTRKEAYTKAIGKGLGALPLEEFVVSLSPGQPGTFLSPGPSEEDGLWSLTDIDIDVNYASAIVVEGPDWELKYKVLTPSF